MTRAQIAGALTLTAFLAAGPGAFSALHDPAGDRAAFAAQFENDGARFSVAGLGNKTLVVETAPPGTSECSVVLDMVSSDRRFTADILARGFDSLECYAYDEAMHIVSFEKRKLVPQEPAKPFKPTEARGSALA